MRWNIRRDVAQQVSTHHTALLYTTVYFLSYILPGTRITSKIIFPLPLNKLIIPPSLTYNILISAVMF